MEESADDSDDATQANRSGGLYLTGNTPRRTGHSNADKVCRRSTAREGAFSEVQELLHTFVEKIEANERES